MVADLIEQTRQVVMEFHRIGGIKFQQGLICLDGRSRFAQGLAGFRQVTMRRRHERIDGEITARIQRYGGPVFGGGVQFHQAQIGVGGGGVTGGELLQCLMFEIGFVQFPMGLGQHPVRVVGAKVVRT